MTSFIDDDGNELIYEGKDFAVTKQVISFHDFKIKGNFSVNLKFSNTAKNRDVLGYFGSEQINPVTKKTFSMIRDGNKIDRGSLVVSAMDKNQIELFFISGNSNLFDQIDFKCNEITTTRYDIRDIESSISGTWTNTEGIIYPIVDFVFGGLKNGNVYYTGMNATTETFYGELRELIPCVYVHTILREIFTHANLILQGNILDDPFFLTLIMTPESVDDIRVGSPNGSIPGGKLTKNIIKPESIAPNIKVVEFLKWLSVSFGAIITFDIESNSCTIDLLDKIDKTQAQDWSKYYVSHKVQTDKYYQFNYIRWKESEELRQAQFNKGRDILYGDVRIDSDKNDGSTKDIYKSPFYASYDVVGDTKQKLATPICEMYRLINKESFSYDSVTEGTDLVGSGGVVGKVAQFNNSSNRFPFGDEISDVIIFYIQTGPYRGYHVSSKANASNLLWSDMPYIGNDSGTLYLQSFEKVDGHKILSCITNISPSEFTQYPDIKINTPSSAFASYSTVATAYFSKIDGIYSTLKNYPQGLNYGPIDESLRHDKSLKDSYMNRLAGILKSPPIKASMVIPKDIFHSYLNQPVFIQAETLTDYYLVERIENYQDEITQVNVYLVKFE